jgi:flavin reductase (DIM6/NTAB) family NADH-FMN oxidoreductase RutF
MDEHQGVLDTFTYGVYIVTCRSQSDVNGLTLAWTMQVSFDPALVAISVSQEWHSHKLLSHSDYFIVHVLAEDQVDIGKFFGTTHGWDTDKFENIEWESGISDTPIIPGCKAVIQCKKIREVVVGDHTLFIGEVVSSRVDETKQEQVLNRNLYFGAEE